MNNHDFTSTGLRDEVSMTANCLGIFFHDFIYLTKQAKESEKKRLRSKMNDQEKKERKEKKNRSSYVTNKWV